MPASIPPTAASCASRQTSYARRSSFGSSPVATVRVHELPQPPRDLLLGLADPRLGRERLERPLRRARRAPDRRELAVVLDRAQPFDEAGRRHELEPARRQVLVLRVRQRVGLEREPPAELLGDVADDRALRQHGLDARDRLRGLDVAEVRVELRRAARGVDEQAGVRALEAREVVDVRQVRDEQRRVEPLAQPVDARAHAPPARPTRNSSASR
jgi:hypothetical protein